MRCVSACLPDNQPGIHLLGQGHAQHWGIRLTAVFLLSASLLKGPPSHQLKWMDGKCRISSRLRAGWVEGTVRASRGSVGCPKRLLPGCLTRARPQRPLLPAWNVPDLTPPHQRFKSWTTFVGHTAKGTMRLFKDKAKGSSWLGSQISPREPISLLCLVLHSSFHFVLQSEIHCSLKAYLSRTLPLTSGCTDSSQGLIRQWCALHPGEESFLNMILE